VSGPAGIPSIGPAEAAQLAESGGALIVDVRERDEFLAERVHGVALVPISEFVARHEALPRDKPLLMLCAAGSRSASATAFLLGHDPATCPAACGGGWTDVRNVVGGMHAWGAAGLSTVTGPLEANEGNLPG
jgi:sulfur dioxygenase